MIPHLNTKHQSQMSQQLLLKKILYWIQHFLDVAHFYCHVHDGNDGDYVFDGEDVVDNENDDDDDPVLYESTNDETQW